MSLFLKIIFTLQNTNSIYNIKKCENNRRFVNQIVFYYLENHCRYYKLSRIKNQFRVTELSAGLFFQVLSISLNENRIFCLYIVIFTYNITKMMIAYAASLTQSRISDKFMFYAFR